MYSYTDSKSRMTSKLHDCFNSYNDVIDFFFVCEKLENFRHRHLGCFPEAIDCNFGVVPSDFVLAECILT